jgi:hypothetical protein
MEKNRLQARLVRITRNIREIQDARLSDPEKLSLPHWSDLSPAHFSPTEGAFNLLKEYPKLNSWVKRKTDRAVTNFISSRDKSVLFAKLKRILTRILSGMDTILERRRATFPRAKTFRRVKYNNKRAVGWRFGLATRRLSGITTSSTVSEIQSAINDLVSLRDMDRTY